MNPIPQDKKDFLKTMSEIHGIPLLDIEKFYEKHLNDEAYTAQFTSQTELLSYVDMLLNGHIQDYVNSTMEEFEVLVFTSSTPRESKKGSIFSNHTCVGKRTAAQIAENTKAGKTGDDKVKWIAIRNGDDSGILDRIAPKSTGVIKVSIGKEEDGAIEAYSRSNSEFVPGEVSFVKVAGINDYIIKQLRNVTIAQAGSNLSAKDNKGYAISYSLRLIKGVMSGRRITKKIDEETKKERTSAIINIMDNSVQMNSEFFKNKQVPDPDNKGKTKTQYGGFSGFCEAEDIEHLDRGTLGYFIGHITSGNTMNVQTIIPVMAVAPKKPSEKLNKPAPAAPAAPAPEVNSANI